MVAELPVLSVVPEVDCLVRKAAQGLEGCSGSWRGWVLMNHSRVLPDSRPTRAPISEQGWGRRLDAATVSSRVESLVML